MQGAAIEEAASVLLTELERFSLSEHAWIRLLIVHVSWRRVDGVAALRVVFAPLALEHAHVEGAGPPVELVEAGSAPQDIEVSWAPVERVAFRCSEEEVIAFITEDGIRAPGAKDGIVSGPAADGVVPGVTVNGIVAAEARDHVVLVAP
jgi:hypothetical protein